MTPEDILRGIYERAEAAALVDKSVIPDIYIRERAAYVCHCTSNRAGVRLLMSCLLGKLDKPALTRANPILKSAIQTVFPAAPTMNNT